VLEGPVLAKVSSVAMTLIRDYQTRRIGKLSAPV
jgi:hypothetical protein